MDSNGVVVAIGADNGAYVYYSKDRQEWKLSAQSLKGESVNSFSYSPKDSLLYAATHTNGVYVSEDFGKSWRPMNRGLHVRKVWTVEVHPKDPSVLYAGTHYGHLFASSDKGKTWSENTGLFKAPRRDKWGIDWGFGTTGLCIHTVRIDTNNPKRIYLVASGNGAYRSNDGGETWKLIQDGVMKYCPIGESKDAPRMPNDEKAKRMEEHLQVHMCTHKLALSKAHPGSIYQQNHCGVYHSPNGGDDWVDISPSNSLRHGFVVGASDGKTESVYIIPAFQNICKLHNSCVKGQLAVYRRDKKGKWEKLTNGLPKKVHTCVLRDSFSVDSLKPAGIYFGTTTGEVYFSNDEGRSWFKLAEGIGRIQGVTSFEPD